MQNFVISYDEFLTNKTNGNMVEKACANIKMKHEWIHICKFWYAKNEFDFCSFNLIYCNHYNIYACERAI